MELHKAHDLKLNVGCGKRVLDGWVNIDAVRASDAPRDPELLCDITKGIDLAAGCAAVVQAIHLFEHFYRWDAERVLDDWYRLLKPGGLLILELPNLVKCCQNYLDGRMRGGKDPDQLARWGIYGDPRTQEPFMNHRWGYSPAELSAILQQHGFKSVTEQPTQHHPAGRKHRDMRLEAIK